MKIAGIKIQKDLKGRAKSITIDLKKHGEALEDFLDNLSIELSANQETIPWEEAVKKLDRKHGIKRQKK